MIFRFEHYWLEHEHFQSILQHAWGIPSSENDKDKRLGSKFKNLRRVLKSWKKLLPSREKTIQNCKDSISFLDMVEEVRDLSLQEWNFREMVREQLSSFLSQQRIYWKQRGTIKWVKFGDECTEFFHANDSIKNKRNTFSTLTSDEGIQVNDHEGTALMLWESFRHRLGKTEFTHMYLDLHTLLPHVEGL